MKTARPPDAPEPRADPGSEGAAAPDAADPRAWQWRPTRRELLAATALGTAVAAVPFPASSAVAPAPAEVQGPGAVALALWVNGSRLKVEVEPRSTLADVLRDRLHLTGTKIGCNRGACSACTVLLDGAPVNSCMTLAIDVGGRKITTIEGLAQGERLHPVQEAFIAHDALQCGFCTPGMVLSSAALLVEKPQPTLDDVREATSGNLCRCGTYPKVFSATLAAAQRRRPGR